MDKKILGCIFRLVWVTFLCSACQKGGLPTPTSMSAVDPNQANFVLHVLNSSNASPNVDVQVYLDGELALNEFFEVGTNEVGITNHKTYYFKLNTGMHTIKAVSVKGEAIFETQFEIDEKKWAIIGYEYSPGPPPDTPPKHFGFQIQNEPIQFQ